MKKITIKGCGLSGLSAALNLLKSNHDVTILMNRSTEPGRDVRSFKNYGDNADFANSFKSITGLDMPDFFPVYKMTYCSPGGIKYTLECKDAPLFYNIIRGNGHDSLDDILLKEAQRLGAKLIYDDHLHDYDIEATGCPEKKIIGVGRHYKNISLDREYIFQDDLIAPKGYLYLSPYKDEASLVSVSFDLNKIITQQEVSDYISHNETLCSLLKGAKQTNYIYGESNFFIPKTAIGLNGALKVGECAGFQDAARGFGMHLALLSGKLAAESIANNRNYDILWKRQIYRKLFRSFVKRLYFNSLNNKDYDNIAAKIVKKLGQTFLVDDYERMRKYNIVQLIKYSALAYLKSRLWPYNTK